MWMEVYKWLYAVPYSSGTPDLLYAKGDYNLTLCSEPSQGTYINDVVPSWFVKAKGIFLLPKIENRVVINSKNRPGYANKASALVFSVSDDELKLRADGGACFPRFPGRVGVGAIDAAAVWVRYEQRSRSLVCSCDRNLSCCCQCLFIQKLKWSRSSSWSGSSNSTNIQLV